MVVVVPGVENVLVVVIEGLLVTCTEGSKGVCCETWVGVLGNFSDLADGTEMLWISMKKMLKHGLVPNDAIHDHVNRRHDKLGNV